MIEHIVSEQQLQAWRLSVDMAIKEMEAPMHELGSHCPSQAELQLESTLDDMDDMLIEEAPDTYDPDDTKEEHDLRQLDECAPGETGRS